MQFKHPILSSGILLCMRSTNETTLHCNSYIVTSSLFDGGHTQNDPCVESIIVYIYLHNWDC